MKNLNLLVNKIIFSEKAVQHTTYIISIIYRTVKGRLDFHLNFYRIRDDLEIENV
jgi:hypothetical protein